MTLSTTIVRWIPGDGVGGAYSDDTPWWPDATTTGYTNAPGYPGSLTDGGTVTSNTTYSFKDYGRLSVGNSSTPVTNVTFIGCRFRGTAVGEYLVALFGSNLRFYFCTFQPAVAAPPVAYSDSYQYGLAGAGSYNTHAEGLIVKYCNFWGFGNAIDFYGSTQANPYIFQHNYFHDPSDPGGQYHTDGIADTTGHGTDEYVLVDHNALECLANTNGIGFQEGSYSHLTITRNLISGWNQAVSVWESGAGSHVFVDNTFSTRLTNLAGPFRESGAWSLSNPTFRRNRWNVPAGAAWGNLADDGKYWINVAAEAGKTSGMSATDALIGTTYPYLCTQVRATPGTGTASVEFTAPTDTGGAAITGYRVRAYLAATYRADYSTVISEATGASSPIAVSGLTPGQAYVFTVAATNSVGYGYESAPSGAVTC